MVSGTLFVTGITGYIGGTVLPIVLRTLKENDITVKIRALVRSEQKAEQVKHWAAARDFDVTPVVGNLSDKAVVTEIANANYVLDTADADNLDFAHYLTQGVDKAIANGKYPVVLHTSGTNLLTDGSFGMKSSGKVYHDDKDEETASIPESAPHRNVDLHLFNHHKANSSKYDLAIIAPPTIWGIGRGPGSIHSQQIPQLINVALQHKQAYNVGKGANIWTQINCVDLAELYALVFVNLAQKHGSATGFYWCEGGEFAWHEVGEQIQQGLIDAGYATNKSQAKDSNPDDQTEFAQIFADKDSYDYNNIIGGNCRVRANRGRKLGWKPKYSSKELFYHHITNEVMMLSRT